MNIKSFFVGIFGANRTDEGVEAVRERGKEDGRELATSYADGFFEGIREVLEERNNGFKQVVEVEPKRLPKKGGKG